MQRLRNFRFWSSAGQVLLGAGGVVVLTFVCYRLRLNVAMAVLGNLVGIVLVSLAGNFLAAALVSLVAALSLNYFFGSPLFTFEVDTPLDWVALAVFLITALVVSRLVSNLRRAVQRAEAAKEELGAVVDAIPALVATTLPDGTVDFINRRSVEFTGLSLADAARPGRSPIHPDDLPIVVNQWRAAVATGQALETEVRVRQADGDYRWMLVRALPRRDAGGRIVKWYATGTDIEDRKQAKEALRESERRYRRIFETAGVSIWEEDFSRVIVAMDELKGQGVTDFRGYFATHPEFVQHAISLVKIIDVNDATLSLLEAQSKEELLVSLDRVFLPETEAVFAEELIALAEGRTFFQDETVLRTLRGEPKAVLFTIAFPAPQTRFDSVLVSIMDVTAARRAQEELRRSEAYLAEAQRLSHTGSWARDLRHPEESYWSDEAYRIFRVNPGGDPATVSREMRERVHPEDWPRLRQTGEQAIREQTDFEVNYRAVLPDGSVRYIHAVGHPVTDSSGSVVELIGTVFDVTDRKRAERALRRARERTLEARFAAVLNERTRLAREIHDTLLQGFTGVALKLLAATNRVTAPPESVIALRDVVALAQKTLTDARRAVWDLRTPSPAGGNFPAAIRTAAEDCVRDTGLALDYNVSGAMQPVDLEIEAVALRVVQESITNVVKHAAASMVRVRLAFETRLVRLTIADDGRGFVVDPDFGTYGGHWGLLGMRERTSQVRGKLSVRSAPGEGTEIVLLLPYMAPRAPSTGYRLAEPPEGQTVPPIVRPLEGASSQL